MINLKFALVTAHQTTSAKVTFLSDDFWNMYIWMECFKESYHYRFEDVRNYSEELDKYEIVMFSGHPAYIDDIINLAEKTKATTIFFPEGDASMYHQNGIQPKIYQAWNACSIVASVEEDKLSFYQALTYRPVKFLHVPVPNSMCEGTFFAGFYLKNNNILIYGDNNPNNPIIALAVAKRLKLSVAVTAMPDSLMNFVEQYLGIKVAKWDVKQSQYEYLQNWVAQSKVLLYPTRWIGTARQVISGAICGTPVIGNRDSHTQKRLFPALGTYIYDIDKMCELVERIYTDNKFYAEVCAYALEQVKFYSMKNAEQRMLEAYESIKK